MTDYSEDALRIKRASTLEEIQSIIRKYPAKVVSEGGILYSGKVGKVGAGEIANDIARKEHLPIIDNTPRGQFLAHENIDKAIKGSAQRIFELQGQAAILAEQSAVDFLYGNAKAPTHSPTSLRNSLWGEASHEFASSLRGDIEAVVANANRARVFAQVEVPAVMSNPGIRSINGIPTDVLRTTQGDLISRVETAYVSRSAPPEKLPAVAPESLARLHPAPAARINLVEVGLKGLGTAAMVYDAASTGMDVKRALDADNRTAAKSSVLHFGARNLGMVGGAVAGAELGAAAGIETGPGAFFTGLAGGVVGAVVGDTIMDAADRYRIYNQRDSDGHSWSMNLAHPERGWMRMVETNELDMVGTALSNGMPVFKTEILHADDPKLVNRLNYQASGTAVELALHHPPNPHNPYVQPSPDNKDASPWVRDPQTHAWSRTVIDNPQLYYALAAHGIVDADNAMHRETANAQKATQLEQAAKATIEQNLSNSPRGMAQRYQQAYEQSGWQQYDPMPPAVTKALNAPDNIVQASDGHTYTKGANGQWTTPGMLYGTNDASAAMREELNATQTQRQAPSPAAASVQTPQPTQEQKPPASAPTSEPRPDDIHVIQKNLHSLGLYGQPDQPLRASGVYDQQTRQAVLQFQKSEKYLPNTGEADQETCAHLVARAFVAEVKRGDRLEREQRQEALARNAPPQSPQIDKPGHSDHDLFTQTQTKLREFNAELGVEMDSRHLNQLAASLAVQAHREGLTRIDKVDLGQTHQDMWASQNNSLALMPVSVNIRAGSNTAIEKSTQQWNEINQQQLDARNEQLAQQQSQGTSMRR
ncbi:MAG: peptidoglycan-binding protein [Pseudomonadales bacterium]|nr:peptidoglycan-binding protein [Pseudomonadales bacterium]